MSKKNQSAKPKKAKSNPVSIEFSEDTAPKKALEKLKKNGVVATLRGTSKGITDILKNTDQQLSIVLATVYAAGLIVKNNDDEWNSLCDAEEWKDHPKAKPKRDDPLRAVMRLAVGFDGAKSNSSVNRYLTALQPLFDQEIAAIEIPRRIREAGGIEKMRQARPPEIVYSMAPKSRNAIMNAANRQKFNAFVTVTTESNGDKKVELAILRTKFGS